MDNSFTKISQFFKSYEMEFLDRGTFILKTPSRLSSYKLRVRNESVAFIETVRDTIKNNDSKIIQLHFDNYTFFSSKIGKLPILVLKGFSKKQGYFNAYEGAAFAKLDASSVVLICFLRLELHPNVLGHFRH